MNSDEDVSIDSVTEDFSLLERYVRLFGDLDDVNNTKIPVP